MLLEFTPHQKIEFLVRTAKFHISAHGDGVIALTERIKELMNSDRQTACVPLGEIIPLQHAGNRMLRRQFDHAGSPQLVKPC